MDRAPTLDDARVTREDLLRKYRALAALRDDPAPAPREVLRALAREFPGALRELDATPRELLDARAQHLESVNDLESAEPWARWIAAYHGLMRVALAVKRRAASRELDPREVVALGAAARAPWGEALGEDFVRAVRRPPGGRVGAVVFDRLGAHFATAPDAIWQALFPTHRADRFARA